MITRHAELFDVEPAEHEPADHPLFATRPLPEVEEDRPPLFGVESNDRFEIVPDDAVRVEPVGDDPEGGSVIDLRSPRD